MIEAGIINWNMKERVAKIIAGEPLSYWRDRFRDCDACVEPVYSVNEAVANPPLSEREMVVEVATMKGGTVRQIGNPIKFKSGHYYAPSCGVTLGHNNHEILSRLGFSAREIEALEACSAVGRK